MGSWLPPASSLKQIQGPVLSSCAELMQLCPQEPAVGERSWTLLKAREHLQRLHQHWKIGWDWAHKVLTFAHFCPLLPPQKAGTIPAQTHLPLASVGCSPKLLFCPGPSSSPLPVIYGISGGGSVSWWPVVCMTWNVLRLLGWVGGGDVQASVPYLPYYTPLKNGELEIRNHFQAANWGSSCLICFPFPLLLSPDFPVAV